MQAYTIHNETNQITAHAAAQQAEDAVNPEWFGTESELSALTSGWPAVRLIEIWNRLPGVTPVSRFRDRTTAVARIWKALQSMSEAPSQQPDVREVVTEAASVPEAASSAQQPAAETAAAAPVTPEAVPEAHVAPAETPAKNKAKRAKKSPQAATQPRGAREGSKTSLVLALLQREGGTTLNEIMAATEWQAHSVRGFLSATIGKKMGLKVESTKTADQKRIYSVQP